MFKTADYEVLQTMSKPMTNIPYGVQMLGAPLEWAETRGAGIKVAVLDTGRPQHPDIRVVDSFVSSNLKNSRDELDHNGHSTHVCGTICANGKIKGVAPEVELYTAKVLDDTGGGDDLSITEGIYWAIQKDVDVINMSLGGRNPQPKLQKAIQFAVQTGIIVVCAAGNAGQSWMAYPAKFDDTIAVVAVDENKEWPDFSSVGEEVELAALGVDVLSTYLNGQYAILRGTSMACPHIAGAIALMQAKAKKRFNRRLSLQEMRTTMNIYAEDIGEPGKDVKHGFGVFSFGRFEKEEYIRPQLKLEIGSNVYYKDGLQRQMDTEPIIDANNRTLVPVRFLAEEYGAKVTFIPPKTVVIE